jgi:glycerol-3-phosphate acyltransferase PlsX
MKTVAVDAMGGDHAPAAIVEGAVAAVRELRIPVVLVGSRERIERELSKHGAEGLGIAVRHASEVIGMDDSPIVALRRKKDNSIRVSLDLVRSGECAAFVSAGNSGAVMASAVMLLGNLGVVDRPAIALEIPSARGGYVTLLDAGANVDCTPLNLIQFAIMGDVYARSVRGLLSPRIGVISNGEESTKGTEITRAADHALRLLPLNYIGYIEGRDVNAGNVDVAVTDGFTGNVILKTMEGFAGFMQILLRRVFERNLRTRLGYLLVKKELATVRQTLDYDSVGGAPLLGVNGVTIIAHGRSSPWAIRNAIRVAAEAAGKNLNGHISGALTTTPGMTELAGAYKRGGFWQQIKGRFRGRDGRDGRAERPEDEGAEGAEADGETPKNE